MQCYIEGTLLDAVATVGSLLQTFSTPSADLEIQLIPSPNPQVDIIYYNCQTSEASAGISAIRNSLTADEFGVAAANIFGQGYAPTGGSGIGDPDSNSPDGLAVVQALRSRCLAVGCDLTSVYLKLTFGPHSGKLVCRSSHVALSKCSSAAPAARIP